MHKGKPWGASWIDENLFYRSIAAIASLGRKWLIPQFVALVAFIALLPGSGHSVNAAILNVVGNFSGTGFAPFIGSEPAPYDPVSGTFNIIYDDSVSSLGILVDFSINLGTNVFDENNSSVVFEELNPVDRLRVFGNLNGSSGSPGTSDFVFAVELPTLAGFITYVDPISTITSWSVGTEFFQPGSLTINAVVTPVPLPATLHLFGTGLGLVGLFLWWRRRRVTTT